MATVKCLEIDRHETMLSKIHQPYFQGNMITLTRSIYVALNWRLRPLGHFALTLTEYIDSSITIFF